MKRSKIYFIGRKQGFGKRRWRLSHLENRRHKESEGLQEASHCIIQTRFISQADSIWVRVRPEFTTDKEVIRINQRLETYRKEKTIINDTSSFYNYDSKDRTFGIWEKENIPCPEFLPISLIDAGNDIDSTIARIKEFIDEHGKAFLRTNNETAANGIALLERDTPMQEVNEKLKILINRCKDFLQQRKDTRIVLVQFINPKTDQSFNDIYRVHLLLGKVISYYVVTANLDVFHNCDMDLNSLNRFIELNTSISEVVEKHKETILRASEVLGCNLGAIEFFIRDGKPIFLEFNPMWGGQASKIGFGNSKFQSYLVENKKDLSEKIPNVYSFLNYKNYYRDLFKNIHYHCSE
mgnify:CR=1 FL=1